ncbi:MAG: hypothetical protein WA623_16240 [Candidatus Sulfotelmatobacter sp.]
MFDGLLTIEYMVNASAADAESSIFAKTVKTSLEVVGSEDKIAVQLYNEFPVVASQSLVTFVESLNNSAPRFAKPSVWQVTHPDPGMLTSISVNNVSGSIG